MSLVESLYLFTLMFDRVECSPWNVVRLVGCYEGWGRGMWRGLAADQDTSLLTSNPGSDPLTRDCQELLSIDNSTILYANEPVDFQLNRYAS